MSTKVRIACRRCRTKRIKCDGGVPACSNCQKAGEPCIDVDGRNNALSIPRDFAASSRARIEWLEDQIRRISPGFDLNEGPKVDFSFMSAVGATSHPAASPVSRDSAQMNSPDAASSTKRAYSSVAESQQDQPFADEARSVALDLGMLTLNSDSRQMHYLGSSSGRLFTSLIGVGSSENATRTNNTRVLSVPSPSSRLGPFAHAKRMKDSCRLLYDSLKKGLPSEDDARVLLEVYFRNIHVDYPFLHPESLISAVEALYQCAMADNTIEIGYNGWVDTVQPFSYNGEFELSRNNHCIPISVFTATFHVFMVFTVASTVRVRQKMYDFAPDQFCRVAMSAAQYCFSSTAIASLQATLLLAVHSLLSPTELNIWTLTYLAMAHCVDLGLHRVANGDGTLSTPALLTRKLLFFTVYHLDRSIAVLQGRPLGIRDETFDIQLPTLAEIQADVLAIQQKTFAPEAPITNNLIFALHRFRLDPIISEIKLLFYHLPSQVTAYAWPTDHQSSQADIRKRLEDWRQELLAITSSLSIEFESDQLDLRKFELKLRSQYFATMILLHQPSQAIPKPSEQALLTCYQCASSRLNAYNDLYLADSYFQSWRSVQGIFSSGATMIYCLWTSAIVRNSIPPAEAMSDLRTCTNLLSVGGEWWPSVKRGKESFGRAMDALLKKLDFAQHQSRRSYGSEQESRLRVQPHLGSTQVQRNAPFVSPATNAQTEAAMSEMSDPLNAGITDAGQFSHLPTHFGITDWTVLDESATHTFHDAYSLPGDYFNTNVGATDSTVEDFIAEFLNNDTAWNPF